MKKATTNQKKIMLEIRLFLLRIILGDRQTNSCHVLWYFCIKMFNFRLNNLGTV